MPPIGPFPWSPAPVLYLESSLRSVPPFGAPRHGANRGIRSQRPDRIGARVDRVSRTAEATLQQRVEQSAADVAGVARRPDYRHRSRSEQRPQRLGRGRIASGNDVRSHNNRLSIVHGNLASSNHVERVTQFTCHTLRVTNPGRVSHGIDSSPRVRAGFRGDRCADCALGLAPQTCHYRTINWTCERFRGGRRGRIWRKRSDAVCNFARVGSGTVIANLTTVDGSCHQFFGGRLPSGMLW